MHDMGGRQGFGPVRYTLEAPAFHANWEIRANSLYAFAVRRGIFNMAAGYYERSLTSLATLLVEKGIVTREELEQRARGHVPLAGPSASGRTNAAMRERFQPGDRVRVRSDYVPGHVRMPGYIRGKTGVVVSESPAYPFPDAHAHAIEAEDEPTYDVRFATEDLWPQSADAALVHVAVFQSYLESAS